MAIAILKALAEVIYHRQLATPRKIYRF